MIDLRLVVEAAPWPDEPEVTSRALCDCDDETCEHRLDETTALDPEGEVR